MKLIIVESPTKARTIESFLKGDFKVTSSYGHVRDLPKSKLGVDVEKDFEPQYIIPLKSRKTVKELKSLLKKSNEVILATDEDREGEAIAWHLAKALDLENAEPKKSKGKSKEEEHKKFDIKRIVFHEITENAINEALGNPRTINLALVDAQQARRVLDRIVGYKLSPFLWKKVARGLSAGRVQSVALRIIVEREEEIRKFNPQEYWEIEAFFRNQDKKEFSSSLYKINGKNVEIGDIKNEEGARKIENDLRNSDFKIESISQKETKKNPLPPFVTSTLQQEAFKKIGFSSKQTMRTAQSLYEKGLITYMRTDSLNLSKDSISLAEKWIGENLGKNYSLSSPRFFKTKSKGAQEAHEAIRPSNPLIAPTSLNKNNEEKFSSPQEEKLYNLIWRRFIACQMPQAIFNLKSIEIEGKGGNLYNLRTSGTTMKFDGFLKIWPTKFQEKEIPEISKSDKISLENILPTQHFTQPPARYNEASLIKTLEEFGIGRPSTYSPIISVIQERNYVIKNEQRKFQPTEIGEKVNEILVKNFPEAVDVEFTAKMEMELDEIADGEKNWREVIGKFYKPFSKNLEEKYETVKKEKPEEEKTDEICDKCGKPMMIKFSRYGKFLACSGFPDCKNAKSLVSSDNPKIKADIKTFGVCPKCSKGDVVMKRTKKGRFFYGCSKYPDCDYASWKEPTSESKV